MYADASTGTGTSGGEPRRATRRRVTIADVARRAGVSKGLVSLALNDRYGVAPATRARILRAASELDWRPSHVARALTHERAYAVGFVLARPAELLATDPFFPAFIAGVEAELSARHLALVLQVVPNVDEELETYRQLAAHRRVDGFIVADLRVGDPRPGFLKGMGLHAVTLGRPDGRRQCPAAVLDDRPGVVAAVDHLARSGPPADRLRRRPRGLPARTAPPRRLARHPGSHRAAGRTGRRR